MFIYTNYCTTNENNVACLPQTECGLVDVTTCRRQQVSSSGDGQSQWIITLHHSVRHGSVVSDEALADA